MVLSLQSVLLHGNKHTADLMSPHGGNPMDGSYTHAVFVSEPLIGTKGFNDLKAGYLVHLIHSITCLLSIVTTPIPTTA
jgi:hypothetical protein